MVIVLIYILLVVYKIFVVAYKLLGYMLILFNWNFIFIVNLVNIKGKILVKFLLIYFIIGGFI